MIQLSYTGVGFKLSGDQDKLCYEFKKANA